jgi:hypothetical protein
MRNVADVDLCAKCKYFSASPPSPPPWDVDGDCTKGWPYTYVSPQANAIAECPQFLVKEPTA